MYSQESSKNVADQATRLYLIKTDDRLFFHNMAHTARLLDAVKKMSTHFGLDEKNIFILSTAAWLFDLEMIASGSGMREIQNTHFTEEFLKKAEITGELTGEIIKCIRAIHSPATSFSQNEKIFRDAYASYLGSPQFSSYHKLLRKEIESFNQEKINGKNWRAQTISLLENYQFETDYCRSLLDKPKAFNLQSELRKQEEMQWQKNQDKDKRGHKISRQGQPVTTGRSGHFPAWKYKSKHHLSGVETVFRNSSTNHLNLSVMADNKAFIMISVNSILISVGIGLIIGKFVLIPKLFIPTVLLLTVNVVTIIYSVLATRPGIMKGTFTREGVDNKTVDLLFFGNFFKMPLADFEYGMRKMMDDDDFLYGNLIRDIYSQGKNLGRKFRLLRISYNLFMYGTACTVIAYVLSFFI